MSDQLETFKAMPLPDGPFVVAIKKKTSHDDPANESAKRLMEWLHSQGRLDVIIAYVDRHSDIEMLDEAAMAVAGWVRKS